MVCSLQRNPENRCQSIVCIPDWICTGMLWIVFELLQLTIFLNRLHSGKAGVRPFKNHAVSSYDKAWLCRFQFEKSVSCASTMILYFEERSSGSDTYDLRNFQGKYDN